MVDAVADRVTYIVREEASRHGADSTIASSLRSREPSTEPWDWAQKASVLNLSFSESNRSVPSWYRLEDPEVARLLAEYDEIQDLDSKPFPDGLVSFSGEATWAGCERVSTGLTWHYSKQATEEWRERRVELTEFRLAIVEQVLREHEVLGYVGVYGESPRQVELGDEQETFLNAALRALKQVDARKLKPSWFAIQGAMSQGTGMSRNKLERIASDLHAFVKASEGTRPSAQEINDRYELFRRQVERHAREAGISAP